MLQAMRRRMDDEKGFTLIELMVVVLIIAILLAVAIPTFLRVRRNAQDRAAQNSVSAALKAEKAFYTQTASNNVYTEDTAELKSIEASIDYTLTAGDVSGGTPNPKMVFVDVTGADSGTVTLVARSASGTYWAITDVAAGAGAGTFYGQNETTMITAAVSGAQWN